MDILFAQNNLVDLIDKYIDKEDYASAYELFLKNKDKLTSEEKENIQYAFSPKYFNKIQSLNIPYHERIKNELENGDPSLAYEIFLENVGNSQKKRIFFLNQCFASAKKCPNVSRKAKINAIINRVLPEHEKHVKHIAPDYSLDYSSFCNKVKSLYDNYDINNHDVTRLKVDKIAYDLTMVRKLVESGDYKEADELLAEINQRNYNDNKQLSQSDLILINAKHTSIVETILNKIANNSDIIDSINLCKTNLLSVASLTTRIRVSNYLIRRINKHCLELFELEQYDKIDNYYKELSETELYSSRDISIYKERTLFSLINPKIQSILGDSVVNKDSAINSILTDKISEILISKKLVSEELLRNYLNNIITRHNNDIEEKIRAEKEKAQRLLDEQRAKEEAERQAREKIRRVCDFRARDIRNHGVKFLYHFTKLDNIRSILRNGLLPVEMLNAFGIDYAGNDDGRFDGQLDTTSISLSFPNWKMFYSLRKQDESCKWAVIELSVNMLDENTFECYSTNAAKGSGEFKVYYGCEMFGNSTDEFPEDPQAELLVKGRIDPKYITKIYVNDSESRDILRDIPKPVEINNYYFSRRGKDL